MLTMFIHTSAALAVACGVLGYLLHRTRRHLADADLANEQLETELEAYRDFEADGDVFFSPAPRPVDVCEDCDGRGIVDNHCSPCLTCSGGGCAPSQPPPSTWPEGQ